MKTRIMKTYLKILFFNILILSGCTAPNNVEVYPISIFLEGFGEFEDCSFDVTQNGTFRVVEGYETTAREKSKKLSDKQRTEINQLVIEIIENGEIINNSYPVNTEDLMIHAIIEGKDYYSPLSIFDENGANALQNLTHMFIKCSPIKLKHRQLL